LGGHRLRKLYGCLDCRAAAQTIARGGYVQHRVFFLDEAAAVAAGYCPCAVCMPEKYVAWKAARLLDSSLDPLLVGQRLIAAFGPSFLLALGAVEVAPPVYRVESFERPELYLAWCAGESRFRSVA
jgi:hypothetical protein